MLQQLRHLAGAFVGVEEQLLAPIVDLAQRHTTVSVERATLRLAGLAGADPDGTPWVNRLADAVRADVGLEQGVALPVWDAVRRLGTYLAPDGPPVTLEQWAVLRGSTGFTCSVTVATSAWPSSA